MSQEPSRTDRFEQHLENGRSAVSAARKAYSNLELTRTVPDSIVEAIGNLDDELDELDRTLNVNNEDVRLAEQTTQRAEVLASVLAALEDYQQFVVDADIRRIHSYASALEKLKEKVDISEELNSQFARLDRQRSMLEKLSNSGRYGQVVNNDRISLGAVDTGLRTLDSKLEARAPADIRRRAYVVSCEDILEEIHEMLSHLNDDNKSKTAFSSDLRRVKDGLETARSAEDETTQAAEHARVALEGAFMLHHAIARVGAEESVAEALAATVPVDELDCDVEDAVSRGDVDALLTAIDEFVGSQAERSAGERISQLLEVHNGSVVRTAEATDYDVPTIVDQLERLYEQQRISDIEVVFTR